MKDEYWITAIRCLRAGPVVCLVLAGLLTGYAPRSNASSQQVLHTSELMLFEDLFAVEDTLVLDPSVILGPIWFIDVDASGSVLITDMQGALAHLFAPTGKHQATYSMETCYPSDFGHSLWISRFAGDDRIILLSWGDNTIVVFDRSGNCLAAKRKATTIMSFCTLGDSMYAFRGPQGPSTSIMDVYSLDLESRREVVLENPEFYRLNGNYLARYRWTKHRLL